MRGYEGVNLKKSTAVDQAKWSGAGPNEIYMSSNDHNSSEGVFYKVSSIRCTHRIFSEYPFVMKHDKLETLNF